MNAPINTLSGMHLTALRRAVSCPVLDGDSSEYDETRRVWNGQIDRRPAAIVRATSIADVMRTVRFSRERGIKASVRGGGHSAAGTGGPPRLFLVRRGSACRMARKSQIL